MYDIVIIGGGAAGLVAAGTAAGDGRRVLLLEKMEKSARKVRITGKGRCNLTNTRERDEFLEKIVCGSAFFAHSFSMFDNLQTIDFFEKNGLKLETERGGRVFPASGKAWDVADSLTQWARRSGAAIECNAKVTGIKTAHGAIESVTVEREGGRSESIPAKNVIIATGGVSYPSTGSTGDGYAFAHSLGHRIVEVRPSLVPLEIEELFSRQLEGLELKNINARLLVDGGEVRAEFGEMEFRDGNAGGAVILKLSRTAVDALIDGRTVELSIDLKPALDSKKLSARIAREIESAGGKISFKDLLRKLLPSKLCTVVAKRCDTRLETTINGNDAKFTETLAGVLKNLRITVTDYRPFREAVVTAGGVDTSQVNPLTMESLIVKGLYFAGEVLDIDADTGGYNLQIAFSTGRLAGQLKK